MKSEGKKNSLMSVPEAARKLGKTRSAIGMAISKKKLIATKENGHWRVSLKDLENYIKNRGTRRFREVNGERIYDFISGKWTIRNVSEYLELSISQVYYLLTSGKIKYKKIGGCIIVLKEDVDVFVVNSNFNTLKSSMT